MAVYFNRNIKILRFKLNKKRGRILDFTFLAILLDFPASKLQKWERDDEPNLAELRKLAAKYSQLLETELLVNDLINRDLRYDQRFRGINT